MSGTTRFDCYPSDFLNGIVGLKPDEIAVYTVVMMMHYDRGEPIEYRGRGRELVTRTGLSRKRLNQVLDRLVNLGKLEWNGDAIGNPRAAAEIVRIHNILEKNRKSSWKGGEATRNRWSGFRNKNNAATGPTGQPNGQPIGQPTPGPSFFLLPSSDIRKLTLPLSEPGKTPVRTKNAYPEDFEAFWKGYPTDANMSKKAAFGVWKRLSAKDHELAIKAVPAYVAYCREHPKYTPKHAQGWLNEHRFDGLAALGDKFSSRVFVHAGSPEWEAWKAHRGGKSLPQTAGNGADDGWWCDSQWPPGHPLGPNERQTG